jgi:uncharacterized protein YijF (DUF1287 family)
MLRRGFLGGVAGLVVIAACERLTAAPASGDRLASAAKAQLGVTTGYDPRYVRMAYPSGDVPRTTGVCADVVVRAGRDGLGLDLQKLVHEDMARDFAAYPKTWGMHGPDPNIDHRRVLNLETYWKRRGCAVWNGDVAGDAFGGAMEVGDLLTWLLDARLPHVGVVVSTRPDGPRVVHNIGAGVQENALEAFREHRAKGHYRWPSS